MKHPSFQLDDEGVTRYRLDFRRGAAVPRALVAEMNKWRHRFFLLRWIGQDPKRYRGVGFGNVSRRLRGTALQPRFVISGTQTGKRAFLTVRHYAIVEKSFPEENRVVATGPCAPSSESMTHAMVYRCDPTARFVVHVHAPLLWKNARKLRLATTRRNVAYGTPEMAAEVAHLFTTRGLKIKKIFAMGGHLDGVISFGRTAAAAGRRLLEYARRAR